MKVLIVDGSKAFGGAFELALTLCRFLQQIEGVETVLISAQPEETLARRCLPHLKYYHLAPSEISAKGGGAKFCAFKRLFFSSLPAALKLKHIAQRERADVIHLNNMLNAQLYGVIAAKLSRIPCVCCHREYEYKSKITSFFERWVDTHIVCSKLIEADVLALGAKREKLAFVWDGVDSAQFSPEIAAASLQNLFGIPSKCKVFAIFGRLVAWKGHEVFLHAAQEVLAEIPEAHAMIVGGTADGEKSYEEKLRQLAQQLGIAERVTFTGFRSDVAALMRASRVLVHASLRPEPFGTALLEGMACGVPYVAMNEGGPAEMITPGESGLLVSPGDAHAMARAIASILKDDALCVQMGQKARVRFLKHFSAEVFANKHYDVYKRTIECAGGRKFWICAE